MDALRAHIANYSFFIRLLIRGCVHVVDGSYIAFYHFIIELKRF